MSSLTKIKKLEKEVKSIFDKASDELNLMLAIKIGRRKTKNLWIV